MSLQDSEITAFIATTHPDQSKHFYRDLLGLALEDDNPFAIVVRAGSVTLRIQKVQSLIPAPHTSLGWTVPDIQSKVRQLTTKGITFERFPGLPQDAHGIWLSPSGAKVCWFKDPDGNILSLTEFP